MGNGMMEMMESRTFHSGEKLYKCKCGECDKSFTTLSSFNSHRIINHSINHKHKKLETLSQFTSPSLGYYFWLIGCCCCLISAVNVFRGVIFVFMETWGTFVLSFLTRLIPSYWLIFCLLYIILTVLLLATPSYRKWT